MPVPTCVQYSAAPDGNAVPVGATFTVRKLLEPVVPRTRTMLSISGA